MTRHLEPGYAKIGATCSAGRRSLWMRLNYSPEGRQHGEEHGVLMADTDTVESIELCAGREGDDDYLRIDHTNPQFAEILGILLTALFAAET
jgi:hypothetical protein